MTFLCLLPAIFSFLLLTAHFLRGGNLPALALCFVLIFVTFFRRPWASRLLQVCLLLGSVEWVRTAISLVMARREVGEPFLRLAIIMGGVALFTFVASLVLRSDRLKAHFNPKSASSSNEAPKTSPAP